LQSLRLLTLSRFSARPAFCWCLSRLRPLPSFPTRRSSDLDIDPLSSGQKIAAMLIGMFRTILRMDPAEIGVKKSHGASAQLVIVQDVQTAYRALGVPPLPPDVQRPPGPAGMTPPVIRRPNPDTSQHSAPGGLGPERVGDTG